MTPFDDDAALVLDSLRRRMRSMHSLWEDAVATMDIDQVNHVEREPVLLGAGDMLWSETWATKLGLTIADHGKHKTVDEMVGQRIGDCAAFREYMDLVFAKTDAWPERSSGCRA